MMLMKHAAVLLVMPALLAADWAPAEKYNLPVQKRTRTCVAMKGEKVPLRFADGTPTGWFARGDDPSMQGENQKDCPPGTLEIDAHETIRTGEGMVLYFHPGGGPGHYRDYINNGQYGHVAASDLKESPRTTPTGNGAAAPLSGIVYVITPTRIPDDMFYKPNANAEGRTGSTYLTYGDPGFDKTGGKGHWTYINWSWVQNGGAEYPANKCNGGGMVRALGKPGMKFEAAMATPIVGYSYGRDNKINGRVTAFYGRAFAGPEEKGDEIFGWVPLCYQKNGEMIVPLIRRGALKDFSEPPAMERQDRMERMAWNLFSPVKVAPAMAYRRLQYLSKQYQRHEDALAKMEVLTELSRIADAGTVDELKLLIKQERDAKVREQAKLLIEFLTTPD